MTRFKVKNGIFRKKSVNSDFFLNFTDTPFIWPWNN